MMFNTFHGQDDDAQIKKLVQQTLQRSLVDDFPGKNRNPISLMLYLKILQPFCPIGIDMPFDADLVHSALFRQMITMLST